MWYVVHFLLPHFPLHAERDCYTTNSYLRIHSLSILLLNEYEGS